MRAEKDRAKREAIQHKRDIIAFQSEADRLSQEHQDQLAHFQRKERVASSSRSRFQRNYLPRRRRPWAPRPLAIVASDSAPSPYQTSRKTRGDAHCFRYRQSNASSRSYTPFDSVAPDLPPRVQSFLFVDRGPSTEVRRVDFLTTTASAARYDRRERSPFEPYHRRDFYQQPQQAGRD